MWGNNEWGQLGLGKISEEQIILRTAIPRRIEKFIKANDFFVEVKNFT